MKEFTEEELSRYDGKNGKRAYVAFKGKVYDVTDSFLWKEGNHQVLHDAGEDFSATMEQAPHREDVLERFPIVGEIRNMRADA